MEQIVRFSPKSAGGGTAVTSCPFPVGFGGFFNDDPNSIYAGTKWEQKKDVFILAAGDTYPAGSTGGEAQHKLTEAEMPSHSHDLAIFNGQTEQTYATFVNNPNWSKNYETTAYSIMATGGSKPHNNMPPYFAMPFWVRTA